MAYVAGFSEEEGNIIGKANQWLYDPTSGLRAFEWNSDLGYSNRVNYHFTTSERRDELALELNKYRNGLGDTLGKLIQIRNRLAANRRFGGFRNPVPLDDKHINDKLRQWAKTDGRDAKRKVLLEIMYYVTRYGEEQRQKKPKPRKKKL